MRCDGWYELFYCNISCVWMIYGKNDCNLQSHECDWQRQVWLQVTTLFLEWNRREASLVVCMMAPCTPPNSSVPTENPPILAPFLGIFNGPFLKSKNRHWSFESIQLSITSTPNTSKLSSNLLLLCSWRLTKTARCVMWCWWRNCIVDITRSNPNCGISDGFFDHIGFWPSWSSREYGEEESERMTSGS